MLKHAIRDLDTGLLVGHHGRWTRDGKLAQDFPDDESAMKAVEQYGVKNAELVAVNEQGHVTSGKPLRLSN